MTALHLGAFGQLAAWLLLGAALVLPFHEVVPRIGPLPVRPFETFLALASAAWLAGTLLGGSAPARSSPAGDPGERPHPDPLPAGRGDDTADPLPAGRGDAAERSLGDPRPWWWPRALDGEVAVVALLGVLALALHAGPGESARTLRLVILEPALFYLLLTRLFRGRDGVLVVARAFVLGGALASVHGFGQLVMQVGTIEAEGVDRIRGPYPSPNNLALYLDRVLPLAAALALAPGRRGSKLVRAGAVVTLAGMALTYSIGGWLASGAALVGVALASGHRWALGGLGMLTLAGVAAFVALRPERVLSHLDLGSATTSGVRVLLWRSALTMLRDHPLAGVGLDNFLYLYSPERGGTYMDPAAWREPDLSHPHNLLLDWWLSLGVLGALLLVWLLFRFGRLAIRAWRATRDDALGRALVVGVAAGFAAGLAHGLIDNSFFLPDVAVLWWSGLALLWMLGEPIATGEGGALMLRDRRTA